MNPATASPTGKRVRRAALVVCLLVWSALLALTAFKSLHMFVSGLGTAPAYGDTVEYWITAETLRVDAVRTWTYPLLLNVAPGAPGSSATIAFVQWVQLIGSIGSAAYFGWVLARLLRLSGRWPVLVVVSTAILAGASFISIHMSQSILQDSLASSAWIVLLGSLLLLIDPQRLRALPWLLAALPAGALVAGLRWERLYVALLTILLAAGALAISRLIGSQGEKLRRASLAGVLAATMIAVSWVTRSTLNVEGRPLPPPGDSFFRIFSEPVVVLKAFLETLLGPVSTIAATDPYDVGVGIGPAVPWTNTRVVDHIAYWPNFLWLSSGLLLGAALLAALVFGLPGLLRRRSGNWPVWLLLTLSMAGLAMLHALMYPWFHPRYALPISVIDLATSAVLVLLLMQEWFGRGQRDSDRDRPLAPAEQDSSHTAAGQRDAGPSPGLQPQG